MGMSILGTIGVAAVIAGVGVSGRLTEDGSGYRDFRGLGSAPATARVTRDVREAMRALELGGWDKTKPALIVEIEHQRMLLVTEGMVSRAWWVSTSKYGIGTTPGSKKTPLGLHRIWRKSGESAKLGQPLRGGEPTDKPISEEPGRIRTYISTRALMLDGLEEANKTSRERGIWIHGTTAESRIGRPASIGCVRMRNVDVRTLFEIVEVGTLVYII